MPAGRGAILRLAVGVFTFTLCVGTLPGHAEQADYAGGAGGVFYSQNDRQNLSADFDNDFSLIVDKDIRALLDECTSALQQEDTKRADKGNAAATIATDLAAEADPEVRKSLPLSIKNYCRELNDRLIAHPYYELANKTTANLSVDDSEHFIYQTQTFNYIRLTTALSINQLQHIVDELPKAEQNKTIWQIITEWLYQFIDNSDVEAPEWLKNFSIPEQIANALLVIISIILVATTIWLIVNEIRKNRSPRRAPHTKTTLQTTESSKKQSLVDISRAPLSLQPGLLLRKILNQLERSKLVLATRPLTHQQINNIRLGEHPSNDLQHISTFAEQTTYGEYQPNLEEIETLNQTADQLLHQIKQLEQ